MPRICNACGEQNREQARFCGYCGRPPQSVTPKPMSGIGDVTAFMA